MWRFDQGVGEIAKLAFVFGKLERRISSYRWALERLVIQAPDGIAADADRLIKELAVHSANPPVLPAMNGCAITVKG